MPLIEIDKALSFFGLFASPLRSCHNRLWRGASVNPISARSLHAMSLSHAELAEKNKQHTFAYWMSGKDWNPISMVRAEGVYFWDADGKRYLDWSSQLVNVNVGHGHPHVIKAIQEQAAKITYAYPGIATEPRARLGEMLAEVLPGGLRKSFFTLGGTDAVETAMKMVRLYT